MTTDILSFIDTNIGVVAVRRRPNAELLYYTQVWRRAGDGEWRKCHLLSRDDESPYTPGLLEAIYAGTDRETIPLEDWW